MSHRASRAIARSMATRWALTSTASACVFDPPRDPVQLVADAGDLPMGPCSKATAPVVQVRVRAMACRSRSDGDTPAAAAFACQAACSEGEHAGADNGGGAVSHRRTAAKNEGRSAPPAT